MTAHARDSRFHVGIDVGSTTVKAVVMDRDCEILWKDYKRHHSRQGEQVRDFLDRIYQRFDRRELRLCITGSGGRSLAPHLGAGYIQEVNAATIAVESLYPDTGSVIELGGQDAKVIIFKQDGTGRRSSLCSMNDKCAGGTGATIDRIFNKIGVATDDAARISARGRMIHPIAAKCGVFAETDVVGLLKNGVDRDEIVVSLCAAIVKQNLEVLVRGHVLRDRVLLLGGPHAYIGVLTEMWRKYIVDLWQLHAWRPREEPIEQLVFVPQNPEYFAAVGAVLYDTDALRMGEAAGRDVPQVRSSRDSLESLDAHLADRRSTDRALGQACRGGLVEDPAEVAELARRYAVPEFAPPPLVSGSSVPVWIGVDGGSTSSKLAVIGERGELLYKDYMLSMGNPISDLRQLFARLGQHLERAGARFEIRGTAVTGYASEILRKAFVLDLQVVETVAHMNSAVDRYGEVDIVCDVGGQDIKVLFMKHGRVTDFRLNTQCSAGNGFFLQWIAEQFQVPIDQYAERAFRARRAPLFNCGCAVFMEQDKVNFQQIGWSEEEIMAGLAHVLPLNIWNYVVQESNIAKYGSRIVLQGGTQKNLAAVKSQVDFIHRKVPSAEVHVHEHTDICGALGAALEVKQALGDRRSSFIGLDAAAEVAFTARNDDQTRCSFCNNRCPRTFVDVDLERGRSVRFISGNSCDKGAAETVAEMRRAERARKQVLASHPNLVQAAYESAFADFDFEPIPERLRTSGRAAWEQRRMMVVGIPQVLNMYFYAPFFNAYLRCLGVGEVIYSGPTTRKLWERGNKWGSIDPCFPAKVAPAHVHELLRGERVTHIFHPIVTHLPSHVLNNLGNNACVIQMGTPEVVEAAFTRERNLFAERRVEYLKPMVRLDRPPEAVDQLQDYLGERLGIAPEENRWAVEQGYAAQDRYLEELREQGRRTIDWLVEHDRFGLVVLGHPYHHDPGLNHGLLEEFQKLGYPILCIESLPIDSDFLDPLFGGEQEICSALEIGDVWGRNFNRNTNHKLWAGKVVARHPNLAAIDLSSFKCGHDAPTYSYMENIMDFSKTPHFLFHDIDQNKPHTSLKIRVQTFEYFLKSEVDALAAAVRELECAAG